MGTLLALAATSPGILVAPDGAPILLDATTGMLLDASNPAHSRARLEIVATGLGRVNPDWPAGKPAPADDPPTVVAPVTAYLERQSRAGDAAGAGAQPDGLLSGGDRASEAGELRGRRSCSIVAGGHASNPVRVYIEP